MAFTDRVEFTKEMKKEGYTILAPNMAPIHFRLFENLFASYGYNVEILQTRGRQIVDEGLKYVHNDTCYPALLTIGQMMDALHSGKYDLHKTALIITQTGGGCRASNYIHLLRKALEKDGLSYIPVISLNMSGLEKNSGFKLTLSMIRKALGVLAYGDLLMLLHNQTRPYEKEAGASRKLVDDWTKKLTDMFAKEKGYSAKEMETILPQIAEAKRKCALVLSAKFTSSIRPSATTIWKSSCSARTAKRWCRVCLASCCLKSITAWKILSFSAAARRSLGL